MVGARAGLAGVDIAPRAHHGPGYGIYGCKIAFLVRKTITISVAINFGSVVIIVPFVGVQLSHSESSSTTQWDLLPREPNSSLSGSDSDPTSPPSMSSIERSSRSSSETSIASASK